MDLINQPATALNIVLAIHSSNLRLAVDLMLNEDPDLVFVGGVSSSEGLKGLLERTDADVIILEGDSPEFHLDKLIETFDYLELSPCIIYLGRDIDHKAAALEGGASAFVLIGGAPELLLEAIWAAAESTPLEQAMNEKREED